MNTVRIASSTLLLIICLLLVAANCPAQGRPAQPQQPKGPERIIPSWTEISGGIPQDRETARKATVFEYFADTASCRMDKPLVIYFFWPDEGKMEKTAFLCSQFEKSFSQASQTQAVLSEFGCFKCDAKNLDKKLQSKLSVKVPGMLFFDATGKKVHTLTKISGDKTVAKKLESIKKASDKAVEKANKKEEEEK